MKLQEHRTITLPLAYLSRIVELAEAGVDAVNGARDTDEDVAIVTALAAAKDPDHTSERWSKIAAALELPDDRPTLDAVLDAVEGLADKGVAFKMPNTRIMDGPALTRGERAELVDENTRLRTALARLLGADAGTAAGLLIFEAESKTPALFSAREAIKRAGLDDSMGSAEAIDTLDAKLFAAVSESARLRSEAADTDTHASVFAFASSATVNEVFNVGDQFKVEVLTWVSKCEDWQPEIGTKVDAGGTFDVIAPGTAVRIHDVGPSPF